MRSSCRFAMAVHVLAVLAYKEGDRVTSAFLASSVNTNPVVIRRLLLTLQGAKLVETRKGAGFGSRLSRAPSRIDLAQIYRAVEIHEPFVMPPRKPNQACPVGHCIQAELVKIFTSCREAMQREMNKITLADVIEEVKACCAKEPKK